MLVGENTNLELGQTVSRGSGHHQGGRSGPPSLVYGNQDIFGLGQTASAEGGYPFIFTVNRAPATVALIDALEGKEFDRATTDMSGRVILFGRIRARVASPMNAVIIDAPDGVVIPSGPVAMASVPPAASGALVGDRNNFMKQFTASYMRGDPWKGRRFSIDLSTATVSSIDVLERAQEEANKAKAVPDLAIIMAARNYAALALEMAKKEGRTQNAATAASIISEMDVLAKTITSKPLPPPSPATAAMTIQEEKKTIPWIPILGGVAVLGIAAFFFLRPKRAAAV